MSFDCHEKLKALQQAYPHLLDIPFELLCCLNSTELKQALLLKTHLLPHANAFKINFLSSFDSSSAQIATTVKWSASKFEPVPTVYKFFGEWRLEWKGKALLNLGKGHLTIHAYSAPVELEHWGRSQAFQIDLGCGTDELSAIATLNESSLEKFLVANERLGQRRFAVIFDRSFANGPGGLHAHPFGFFGPIYSLSGDSVELTSNVPFDVLDQSGASYQIYITKPSIPTEGSINKVAQLLGVSITEAKLDLFKRSKERLPFIETLDISKLVETFNELVKIDFQPVLKVVHSKGSS